MIVLGVDPGLKTTGFALLKKTDRGSIVILDYGYLALPPLRPIPTRIGLFYDFFLEKIDKFQLASQAASIALETPFLGKNTQSFLKLGYLRGILYLLGNQHSLTLQDFTPCQVKQSVTGYGMASKEQLARALTLYFPTLKKEVLKADVTDALAVALCGIWQGNKKL